MLQYLLMGVTGGVSAEVGMSKTTFEKNGAGISYCNMELNPDGNIYENSSNSSDNYTSNVGTWLNEGSASNIWVAYSSLSGTLNHDPTTARHQLSTAYQIGNIDTVSDATPVVTTFTLSFYDAATGGELLGTESIQLTASRTS